MLDLTSDIQKAIEYIEEHLTDDMDISDISGIAYLSPFHFQRIFHAMCGCTVGEYIRMRRLSMAGVELMNSGIRVIDLAIKYGYDSPDSFTRAFTKFHGLPPSVAKARGIKLKFLAPIQINKKTGKIKDMDYRVVEKSQFTVVGYCRRFNSETSYTDIPKFWDEVFAKEDNTIEGMFGVCLDGDGMSFDYLIADMYLPWKDIPDGCVTKTIEACTWAVFPWTGQCPEALQTVNTWVWNEWLPNCTEYELSTNCSLEVYLSMEHGEIWVPVKKK